MPRVFKRCVLRLLRPHDRNTWTSDMLFNDVQDLAETRASFAKTRAKLHSEQEASAQLKEEVRSVPHGPQGLQWYGMVPIGCSCTGRFISLALLLSPALGLVGTDKERTEPAAPSV